MARHYTDIDPELMQIFRQGAVIPAHPLALDADRRFDRRRQRALTRYYVDAGVGGLAVGVHTTQFAIREKGYYETVLKAAIEDSRDWTDRPLFMVAGIAGQTEQALNEARKAVELGYHAGLVSLSALKDADTDTLIAHCEKVSAEIPIIGFYMQTAVGGIELDASFWERFGRIDNAIGIKAAPFNRYRTLDVMRGIVAAGAEDRITLYTGNDDHIVADLLTPFVVRRDGRSVTVRFRGGLLGHWSVWTRRAVQLLERIHAAVDGDGSLDTELLALDSRVTDCNAAFFDVANDFHGCIAGCHEVLRRQGLLDGIWCLDLAEGLGPGQSREISRVYAEHPDLSDDDFVRENLERWLS
ncbi:dihydrodipicolinate synthase family protein [Chelativorans sp. YIM 93263]|uniref:dihydrodipicolinate synthase family protein n=1 Tax=Chelativorans sp. YIM 93263 TaxID=2906648 RepID=UPI002379C09A|nr:dihydrodipicolinate synthase family protein [Chelativorans sp. YIM 93263]